MILTEDDQGAVTSPGQVNNIPDNGQSINVTDLYKFTKALYNITIKTIW